MGGLWAGAPFLSARTGDMWLGTAVPWAGAADLLAATTGLWAGAGVRWDQLLLVL